MRERRRPDVELLTAQGRQSQIEVRAERLDQEINGLHANQHRRNSHLAAHHADQIELDAIRHELGERTRQQTNRAVIDPPGYITKGLGPRPGKREQDRAWVSAVVAVEKYRTEHDITDQRTTIGPRPTDNHGIIDWNRAAETISDASSSSPHPSRPRSRRRSNLHRWESSSSLTALLMPVWVRVDFVFDLERSRRGRRRRLDF